jgi:lipoic acid synthetase
LYLILKFRRFLFRNYSKGLKNVKVIKKPYWLRTKLPSGINYSKIVNLLRDSKLHTVCQEAKCPNIGDCFSCGKATFLIMGNICTRNCRFCAVSHGIPEPPDKNEPQEVALSIAKLNLTYGVITSVTRDDLPDGGAGHFAETVKSVRHLNPSMKIELLIPDLNGDREALETILLSEPDVLNHNLETVPDLYDTVRPQAIYSRSLKLLKNAKKLSHEITTKSGLMVGLGETIEQVVDVIKDLVNAGCDILTIGQYLAPSENHLPVNRYVRPEEFEYLKEEGEKLGIKKVISAPLIRSSYYRGNNG